MTAVSDTLMSLDRETLLALYRASRRLARAPAAPQILRALLEGARDALGCSAAAVYCDEGRAGEGALHLADSLPAGATLPARLAPGGVWLRGLARARVLAAEGRPDEDPAAAVAAQSAGETTLAAAAALGGAGGLRGVLIALWPGEEARPEGWAVALAALAEDAGHALERVAALPPEALASVRDAHGLLGAVNAVTDIGLLYSSVLDRLLAAMLGQILELLGLGGGAIFLHNEQTELVDFALAARGPGPGDVGGLWEAPLLGEALAHARETARLGFPAELAAAEGPAAGLAGGLRELGGGGGGGGGRGGGGGGGGVLQVVAAPGERVREGQVQVLRILARQTAVAIENARLFAQTRADQERARAVVDATNDAILMLDEHRRPMIVNRRARFFFGLTERDLLGKSFDQLGSAFGRIFEDGQRFNSWLGQLLRSQSERAVDEFGILSPEPRLLQCFSAPVMDVHDRYLGRLLVFRDITRERAVERMKNDFVSIVSHELRTPLTSIQGALQLVLGKPGSGEGGLGAGMQQRSRDLLSISLANAERLIRLINDILDIAKIEQGRIQLRREALAPDELCRAAAAAMGAFASDRGVALEVRLPAGLPAVLADRDRSLQVLINLISNGIKFSPAGQRVVVGAHREGPLLCFTVQDWGRGIAAEHHERIFEKFQQIDSSTTREVGGTGLGLAISKALVEEQGGRMWLTSEPAGGSTFSFTLPIAPGADRGEAGSPRALVAEADGEARSAVCAALAAAGWEAVPADGAAALLEQARGGEAELMVVGRPLAGDAKLLAELRAAAGTAAAPMLLLSDDPPAELPRDSEVIGRARASEGVAGRAAQLLAARRPLVLVVDDDPHVRPVLVRLLQRHGLRAAHAGDGYGALAAVERQRPDVMLLDIKMPGLNGFEVLRRLKANRATATIPVIILTANDLSEPARAEGQELGARAYLEKPIAYERLIGTIKSVLRAGATP